MDELRWVLDQVPDHSRDVAASLRKVVDRWSLGPAALWGTALACAVARRSRPLAETCDIEARRAGVAEATLDDARAAAALMTMTAVHYRFAHPVGDGAYAEQPALLSMKRSARPAGEPLDYELFALAVSALEGCSACVRLHEKKLRAGGRTPAEIREAVRLAAAVAGVATALEAARPAS